MTALDADVIVAGAGAAGLAAGLALADAGRDVLVLEAGSEAGGNLRAVAQNGALLALGPQAFPRSASNAWWLVARAGLLAAITAPASGAARYLFRDGRLQRLPASPLALATTSLLSTRGKLRLLAEPLQPAGRADESETARTFLTRRLGQEAVDALAAPFMTGIHAADPDSLEARSAFASLVRWERERGSILGGALAEKLASRNGHARAPSDVARAALYSVKGGLSHLARRSAEELGQRLVVGTPTLDARRESGGWRILTGTGALRCRHLVLALPPHHAARVLAGTAPEASRLASGVPMAPVGVVHLGGELARADAGREPSGFGALVARGEGLRSLGIVFTSALFPDVAPAGSWLQATYVGGALDPRVLDHPDATLASIVAAETRRILGIDPARGITRVIRHEAGIPQMVVGHASRIAALRREAAALGSISLAGNWLDGIGLDAAIASGRRAAAEAMEAGRAA